LKKLIDSGEQYDEVVTIGPLIMMKFVSKLTKEYGIKTVASMNLIADLEHYLGYDNVDMAILIGAGNLGRALLAYEGFAEYGIDIVTAFDIDESITGSTLYGKQILSVDKLPSVFSRMKIKIGIIAVVSKEAQNICNLLIESGVMAIWNFAPVHLNENMASSLAVLSNHLVEKLSVKL